MNNHNDEGLARRIRRFLSHPAIVELARIAGKSLMRWADKQADESSDEDDEDEA